MNKRGYLTTVIATALAAGIALPVFAQETVKIGLILPMTGPFASPRRRGPSVFARKRRWIPAFAGMMVGVDRRVAPS